MKDNVYIIGDVHGCFNTLMALVDKLPKDAELIFVGDLIDRGPLSRKVIDFIRDNGYVSVQGNHEEMMCSAIEDLIEYDAPLWNSPWVANGGNTVLEEYKDISGKVDNQALQKDYEYLLNLPKVYIDTKVTDEQGRKLLVTHTASGDIIDGYLEAVELVANGITDEVTEHAMIDHEHRVSNNEMLMQWDRRVPQKIQTSYFNVFGHTPTDGWAYKDNVVGCVTNDYVIIDKVKGFANIDTGCVYHSDDYGPYRGKMTAIHFPTLEVTQQENIDVF